MALLPCCVNSSSPDRLDRLSIYFWILLLLYYVPTILFCCAGRDLSQWRHHRFLPEVSPVQRSSTGRQRPVSRESIPYVKCLWSTKHLLKCKFRSHHAQNIGSGPKFFFEENIPGLELDNDIRIFLFFLRQCWDLANIRGHTSVI